MGDTFVAYDNATSTLHELNEVAYDILLALEKGKSKGKIANLLSSKYLGSQRKAEKDLNEFLKELKTKNLIEGRK